MSYTLVHMDLENDKKDVINFWKTNFPKWPEGKYSWFYEKNIYGKATCWIVRNSEGGGVIGTTAIFPRRFRLGDQVLLGYVTGGFAVDKNHRILGPALQLQRAVIASCTGEQIDFLYGLPNRLSEPVQKRVGFKVVGSTVRLIKVFRSYRYIRRVLKQPFLTRLVSVFVDLVLKLLAKENHYKMRKDLQGEAVFSFDRSFDQLWKKASQNFGLMGERTSRFLKWRFIECPHIDYKIFVLKGRQNNDLLGYVVYYLTKDGANIADLLASDNEETLENLIAHFLKFLGKSGCDAVSITYFGNKMFIEKLRKFNFSKRFDERRIVVYVNSNASYVRDIFDQNKWYFLEVDND